jgi:transposase-like protein
MAEDYPATLAGFEERFGSDEACRAYLVGLRWPGGFVSPRCQGKDAWSARRNLLICRGCQYEASVMAGTIFQDTHLPLRTWFRAMWYVTSQKNGASALGLQRVLGLGSYKTAWAMLHKLRRAMVRPGRERLSGKVEVDESYWGSEEEGVIGRLTHKKALIAVAVQEDGKRIGRIRMRRIPDTTKATLHGFIAESVEPGAIVRTDGLRAYLGMDGYTHDRVVQRDQEPGAEPLMPKAHLVISLLKRWLLGTHQGAIGHEHLDYYLDEFVFRFNRRTSSSRGKLFYRLAQQAVAVDPAPFATLIKPQSVGDAGVR